MWTWVQASGRLVTPEGVTAGMGYSGAPSFVNDPSADNLIDQGPIPRGVYRIGDPFDSPEHGPFVLPLTPDPANVMHGRAGFLIHGDSIERPGQASEGCIILPRDVREAIAASGDRGLEVVAEAGVSA